MAVNHWVIGSSPVIPAKLLINYIMTDKKVLIILLKILWIFILPFLFMLIWNNIMPTLCGFALITYWQSFFFGLGLRLINGTVGIKLQLNDQ